MLADSSSGEIICFNYGLSQLGYSKRSEAEIREIIGLSLPNAYHCFVPEAKKQDFYSFVKRPKEKADEVMLEI